MSDITSSLAAAVAAFDAGQADPEIAQLDPCLVHDAALELTIDAWNLASKALKATGRKALIARLSAREAGRPASLAESGLSLLSHAGVLS